MNVSPARPRPATVRLAAVSAATAALIAATASSASAHGIGSDATERGIAGFVPLGIEHMLVGWDHLLFVAGVLLIADGVARAAKLISVFALGHSTTLIVATAADWQVSADVVDIVIVLSVVFVGIVGMVGRPKRWNLFGAVVLGFGLVHGLGLATRLQDLGLPEDNLIWRVIAFNIGIEIGQLTAIVGMLAVAAVLSMLFGLDEPARRPKAVTVAATGLFIVGAMAAPLMTYNHFKGETGEETGLAFEDSTCEIGPRSVTFPGGGGHASKSFYEPDEGAPMLSFGHSLGDGYLIVLYPPDLAADDLDELRAWEASPDGYGVLVGPTPADGPEGITATTLKETMTCSDFELAPIREFVSTWTESVR